MTWYPIAFLPPQIENASGVPYSGAVIKCYKAGTSTPIAMATDYIGLTTAATFPLNASGYPTYQGTIIIPHLQENYKMALYPDQASADANSGAIWTIDNNQIASDTNTPFIQYFDGDGVNGTFTLSESFGTDPTVLLVFSDRAIRNFTANTDFATDTIWTKGAGWTIGAGVATATGAISTALSQNALTPIVQGQSYTVEFTVTASAGTVTPSVGGNSGTTRGAGTWRETIIAGATQVIAFTGVGFTGTLDNASVKATENSVRMINRPDEMTLAGNILTLQNIPSAGTKNVIVFAPSLLIGAASASAAAAAISEANALIYKNQAEVYATTILGTSTTSNTVGTGSKSFTTQTSKTFATGQFVTIASNATPANFMYGQVTSYNSGTGALVVNVSEIGGSGTLTDWNISISGTKGIPGTVADGVVTFAKMAASALGTLAEVVSAAASKLVTVAVLRSYVTSWVAYTPVFTGFGTVTGIEFYSRRVGDTLEIRGKFTAGTTTGVEARMELGFNGTSGGITSDGSAKLPSATSVAGSMAFGSASASVIIHPLIERSVNYITFGSQTAGTAGLSKQLGTFVSSGQTISLTASVPISGW